MDACLRVREIFLLAASCAIMLLACGSRRNSIALRKRRQASTQASKTTKDRHDIKTSNTTATDPLYFSNKQPTSIFN
jgi:hypothetical protein